MSFTRGIRPARFVTVLLTSASLLSASLLSGCAAQGGMSTRESRIGPNDGDVCYQYRVALDSTGNYFGPQILAGAAVGAGAGALAGGLLGGDLKGALVGAAVGGALGATGAYLAALQQQNQDQAAMRAQMRGDLARENAQIDNTQIAFDQLMDCRYHQGQQVQASYRAHLVDRPTAVAQMGAIKQRAEQDLVIARQINAQIGDRAQQFEVAADNVAPGTGAVYTPPPPRQTQLRQPTTLKLRPDPAAPDVAQLNARQNVTVTSARNGYSVVETPTGQRGFVPNSALAAPAPTRAAGRPGTAAATTTAANTDNGDVRTLAGSNAARRDSFAQSVSVSETAVSNGFELSS